MHLLKPRLEWLLAGLPLAIIGRYGLHADVLTFVAAACAIVPLAGLIGHSTDQLSVYAGPRVGGLLNATFGNVTELILVILLILANQFEVVKASLTGSILGNLLLVLGLSFITGGIKHPEMEFDARAASIHSGSLMLAVMGLLLPALFVITTHGNDTFLQREVISAAVSIVLIGLYGAALIFMLVTHKHLFRTPEAGEHAEWSLKRAVITLVVATTVVAYTAELLVHALEPTVHKVGLNPLFVGLIIVPIIGNAAEHSSALLFAWKNRLDTSLEIAVGSSTQIALFIAPVAVLLSLALGHPMDIMFSPFEIAAVAISTLIVTILLRDGRTDWLEGAQLVGAYAIVAISFFFVGGEHSAG